MKKKVFLLLIVLGLLFYSGFNLYRSKKTTSEKGVKQEIIPVKVTKVKRGKLPIVIETTGNLLPDKQVKIYPKVPGKIIEKIFVDKGDIVKQGDLIALLEKKEINAMLKQAEAELKALKSELELTKIDYKRILNLFKTNSVSKQKLDQIQTKLTSINAKIEAALAHIDYLKVLKNNHNVYATIDGIITDRYLDSGSFSSTSVPIVSINKETKLKLITQVPEVYFSKLSVGKLIEFTVDSYKNKIFRSKVDVIYPTIDFKTRTVKIEAIVENKNLKLRSGMFCNVKIYIGDQEGIVAPMDVLNKIPGTGSNFIYVVKDNRVYMKNVTTGISYKNNVILLNGVKDGDLVVVNASNRLSNGKIVSIVEEM